MLDNNILLTPLLDITFKSMFTKDRDDSRKALRCFVSALIEAPVKELHWFEESGHNPLFDEPLKFKNLIKEKLLPIAAKENI